MVNDKTRRVFCEVGKVYLNKRMQLIEELKVQREVHMERKD